MGHLEWLRDILAGPWVTALNNAQGLWGVIGALAIWIWGLFKTLKKAWYDNRVLRKRLEGERKSGDEPAEEPEPGATFQYWDQIRKRWRAARDRTERKIEGLHGNMRNTFVDVDRYSYDQIATMLFQKGQLSRIASDGLRELDRMALGLRRSKTATREDAVKAERLYKELDNELPTSDDV